MNNNSPEISVENPQLSVVIPAYNEEGNVKKLYVSLVEVLQSLGMTWEIIYTDDGSKDNSWKEITSLYNKDKRVKGLRLSRNFGHQYALLAGLSYAKGEAVITIDADLQHPPELIKELVSEWQKGNKIVHTVRIDDLKSSFFKNFISKLFYRIWSFLSGIEIESGMADYRLLDRQVLNSVLKFREEALFLRGIVQWVGYTSSKVYYDCQERFSGKSKYTARKMIKFALAGISSFSLVPLRIGIFVGVITSLASFGEIIYALYSHIILNATVPGWTSAVSILSFLFGILFILLGLIGLYIGEILIEVKRRPRYFVRQSLGIDDSNY